MFCNCKNKIEELILKIEGMEKTYSEFFIHSRKMLDYVMENDKKKFMYQLQVEDCEMIEEGKKVKKIRKILS